VLLDFKDVFLEEIPRLHPKRDINFIVDIVPKDALVSKVPYIMSTLKLLELKM